MSATQQMGVFQQPAKIPIIVLQGPTAVGKTATALTLAKKLPLEIVNADSMQVYRYMDIGTSKPTSLEQQQAPHHLLSVVNPDEPSNFSAWTYSGCST